MIILKKHMLFILGITFLIIAVSGFSIISIKNPITEENLTYTPDYQFTRDITLPLYSNVTSAFFNLTGYFLNLTIINNSFETGMDGWTNASAYRSDARPTEGIYSILINLSEVSTGSIEQNYRMDNISYVMYDFNLSNAGSSV